jgi:hypothetical protein
VFWVITARAAFLLSSLFFGCDLVNMASRSNSVAVQNANIKQRADKVAQQVEAEATWIEKKLKPSKVAARYPIKGAALLYATCGFGSLGDALFGYNSGIVCTYF